MKHILGLAITWFCITATAEPALECRKFRKQLALDQSQQCYCGPQLKALTVTPPKGLNIVAACSLRRADGSEIDLLKEKVSLDRYDKNGNTIDGYFYFAGELVLDGLVQYEPSDAGDWWFRPSSKIQIPDGAFEPNFRSIHLPLAVYSKLKIPKNAVARGQCMGAKSRVRLREIYVSASESDDNGVHPQSVEFLYLAAFSTCK